MHLISSHCCIIEYSLLFGCSALVIAKGGSGASPRGAHLDEKSDAGADAKRLAPIGGGSFQSLQTDGLLSVSDPKPLRPLRGAAMQPLPSIGARPPLQSLDERRKITEETLRRNMQQLEENRRHEEELRQKIAGIDPQEAQRRAEHMKRQRDLLVAKKKKEREQKVREEEERTAKRRDADREVLEESLQRLGEQALHANQKGGDAKGGGDGDGPSEEELMEMRRSSMRAALARRMRMNLIESEEERVSQMQEEQFSELDKKLKQVEQLREDNRKREMLLSKQLERQQALIARNMRLSAAEMHQEYDD